LSQETALASRASLGWVLGPERQRQLAAERRAALQRQLEHEAHLAQLAERLPSGYCRYCCRPLDPSRSVCGDECADGWEPIVPGW
jgi:hypothetical protein